MTTRISTSAIWPYVERVQRLVRAQRGGPATRPQSSLDDLPSPACLVNFRQLLKNCDEMLQICRQNQIQLRPMTKTHKTIEGALLQLFGSEGIEKLTLEDFEKRSPITVSTMGEATFYAQAGFRDILFPYAASIDKLRQALKLQRVGVRVLLGVDNREVFEQIVAFCKANQTSFEVYLDLDPTEHRTGVDPEDPASLNLARDIVSSGVLTLHGLYVHGGHSYNASNPAEIAAIAQQERDTATNVVEALAGQTIRLEDYPAGKLLEIVPNHSCMSCYCYENLHIVNDSGEVIDVWRTWPRHSPLDLQI